MKKILSIIAVLAAASTMALAQTYSNLIPQPLRVIPGDGVFVMEKGLSLCAPDALESERTYLQRHLENVFAFDMDLRDVPVYYGISLNLVEGMDSEAYRLSVSSTQIVIEASDAAGIFYGVQTLLQMMPPAVYGQTDMELTRYELDAVAVEDAPR